MAPGLLSETPSVEDTRETIAVVAVNSKKDAEKTNGVKVNGEAHDADAQLEGKSAEPAGEAKPNGDDQPEESDSEEPEDLTMKCVVKHLDRRYDDDDEMYYGERKAEKDTAGKRDKKDWWKLFAICLVRNYDSDGEQEHNSLHVHPQALRELLADVIGKYPGSPIDADEVEIAEPYHSLFYYREQLEAEGLKRFAEDSESREQLQLLLNWIKTHFELDIAAHKRCTTQEHKAIAYDRLWTLFPPGTIVYSNFLSQNRAFRVVSNYYETSETSPSLNISTDFVDFNGEKLGTRRLELSIPKYQGTQTLSEIGILPIDLLDDASDVREELLNRGRRFESYVGQHFLKYDGIAIKKVQSGYARFTVSGRVMIDCKTYLRLEPNEGFIVANIGDSVKMERSRKRAMGQMTFAESDGTTPKFEKLSDEDAMLTNATVRGYSFSLKRFLEFFVEDLSDIEWNTSCFEDLVLDTAVKRTVQALVTSHAQKRDSFDDIVKGKGMGLVCVLHGPPGVGKTLTAECVAELVKRPLYMVSSGDRKFVSLPCL
jgi:hypothetical protein